MVSPNSATGVRSAAFASSTGGGTIGFGLSGASSSKWCIYKFDGTTRTELAVEPGAGSVLGNTLLRIDFMVVNYGTSATVNFYVNGTSILTYTGNITVSGTTNFDSVVISPAPSAGGEDQNYSEIIVADTDTRGFQGLQVLALTGAGTTNSWTDPTYTDINGISFSDANPAYVDTTGADQQYTVTTPTPAVYSVAGVVISARMAVGSGSVPTQVKLGYNSGGTVGFGTGAAKTPTSAYQTFQQIDMINPVTGVAFTQSDLAALQLDLRSA
jgi:hypothetical protein